MQELCNKKAVFPFREAFSDTLPASAAELALQTHLGSIIFIENSQSPTEYDFKCLQHQSSFQSWRFGPVHYLCMSTQLSNLAHAHTYTHTYTHTHIHTHMYWPWFFGTLCDLARCHIDDTLRQEGLGAQNLFRSLEKDRPHGFGSNGLPVRQLMRVIACTSLFWGVHINGKEKAIFKRLGRVTWQGFLLTKICCNLKFNASC